MAKPSLQLIEALRETALRLRNGAHYAWGNHGACNCGNLFQVITPYTEGEILRYAQSGIGDWGMITEEYCPDIHLPVNQITTKLEEAGLTPVDIHNIEQLTDKEVLNHLPGGFRWLKKNVREDVILYFEAFADLLEQKMPLLHIDSLITETETISA